MQPSAVWGTPLLCEIRFGFEEVIQILHDAGADPTMRASCQKFEDQSPIELAKRGIKLRGYHGMKAEYQRILKLLEMHKLVMLLLQLLCLQSQPFRMLQSLQQRNGMPLKHAL